jgi:hypothetical protein
MLAGMRKLSKLVAFHAGTSSVVSMTQVLSGGLGDGTQQQQRYPQDRPLISVQKLVQPHLEQALCGAGG